MFDIEYKGGNTIVITTKKTELIFDPKRSVFGLKDMPVNESVEITTEERLAINDPKSKLHIDGPGEYEVGDVSIRGVRAYRHIDATMGEQLSTMYRVEIGDVRLAILGNIAPKLQDDQLEALGVIDVVIIPVGGNGYTLDSVSASTIVRQIDPRAVIPVHYHDSGLKYEVQQDDVQLFIKELAAPVEELGTKLKIKSTASIPQVLTTLKLERS